MRIFKKYFGIISLIFILILILVSCNNIAPIKSIYKISSNNSSNNSRSIVIDWKSDRIIDSDKNNFHINALSDELRVNLKTPNSASQFKSPYSKFDQGKIFGGGNGPFIGNFNGNSSILPSPALFTLEGEKFIIFTTDSQNGVNLFAMKTSGITKWQASIHKNIESRFLGSSPSMAEDLYVDSEKRIYITDNKGWLYCIDAVGGNIIAAVEINEETFINTSPWVKEENSSEDSIILASNRGRIIKYIFNLSTKTFTNVYNKKISEGFNVSPVVDDNYIYIGGIDGIFYVINKSDGVIKDQFHLRSGVDSYFETEKRGVRPDSNESGKIMGTAIIDKVNHKIFVPCGSYLFMIDNGYIYQSPLLELSQVVLSNITEKIGPVTPNVTKTVLKGSSSSSLTFDFLESNELNVGDYLVLLSTTSENTAESYGKIYEIDTSSKKVTLNPGFILTPSEGRVVSKNPVVLDATSSTVTIGGIDDINFLNYGGYLRINGEGVNLIPTGNPNEYNVIPNFTNIPKKGDMIPFYNIITGFESNLNTLYVGSLAGFSEGDYIRINRKNGYEYGKIKSIVRSSATTDNSLIIEPPLSSAPDIAELNWGIKIDKLSCNPFFGKVFTSTDSESHGDILSSPAVDSSNKCVYITNGNVLFELSYSDKNNFVNSANYILTQAARLSIDNRNLTPSLGGSPTVIGNKVYVIDQDISKSTGIFMNRFNIPLNSTVDKLNAFFPILDADNNGFLPRKSFSLVIYDNPTDPDPYIYFSGGNGIIYKLSQTGGW